MWPTPARSCALPVCVFRSGSEAIFPETSVLPGMFKLVENLYGIIIKRIEENVQLWHPDVKFFTISDSGGKLIGHFYLDLVRTARQARRRMDG